MDGSLSFICVANAVLEQFKSQHFTIGSCIVPGERMHAQAVVGQTEQGHQYGQCSSFIIVAICPMASHAKESRDEAREAIEFFIMQGQPEADISN
jgi:hypothetical protein